MKHKNTGEPETDEEYIGRLRHLVTTEHSEKEIIEAGKIADKNRKAQEKVDKEKAKEEYKQKKLERRNQGKKNENEEGEEDNG